MKSRNLIGVDAGTTSIKAGLVTLDGELLDVVSEPSNLISRGEGHIEQDPDEILSAALKAIKGVLDKSGADPGEILGIGFDGQMAGIMAIDREFRPVTPYDSWLDTRCAPYVERMKEEAGEEVLASTDSLEKLGKEAGVAPSAEEKAEE